jgi:hypothetical protein
LRISEGDDDGRIVGDQRFVCIHCVLHCGLSLSEGWFPVNTSG